MLQNIRHHSFVVARVVERIYSTLSLKLPKDNLPPIDLLLSGALLHDIAKTKCLKEQCDHAEVGAEICLHHGYPEIAEIVAEHVRLLRYEQERYKKGIFLAKELVFYADKRVMHDQIVNLSQRLDYILERYGNNDPVRFQAIRRNFDSCRQLEDSLCECAGVDPESLLQGISHDNFT